MKKTYAMGVVGGGLVGLMAVLRLARICEKRGEQLAFVAPLHPSNDKRTTAMLMPSVELLEELNLWSGLKDHTAPLKTMRLIDGSNRLIRAPTVDFRASELGLEAFGYNVPNAKLSDLLEDVIAQHGSIVRFDAHLASANCGDEAVELVLDNGETLTVDYAIAADGRHSVLRGAAGIDIRESSYPQTAIVVNFAHSHPHGCVSTEFHTKTGPFTQVPLPPLPRSPNRSSLVWVVRPEDVNDLLALPLDTLSLMVEEKLHSHLGKVTLEEAPKTFPLVTMTALEFAKGRVALVGETAHVLPPIGAQGFNLGLRDVRDISLELEKTNHNNYSSISMNYSKLRRNDINIKSLGIDIMNRSLLTDFLPVQAFRASGLSALRALPWLRKIAMTQGLGNKVLGNQAWVPSLRE